jgi:toxin-antitoxin system PIN domain toxin
LISIDTNLLLFAQNSDCPEHGKAYEFVLDAGGRSNVIICELVLVELYVLLRNPAVLARPLSAGTAAEICCSYRTNRNWRLVEYAPVMDGVWELASQRNFARRKIFDYRLALTLQHHGTKELATANVKDFDGLGFDRIWNPLTD